MACTPLLPHTTRPFRVARCVATRPSPPGPICLAAHRRRLALERCVAVLRRQHLPAPRNHRGQLQLPRPHATAPCRHLLGRRLQLALCNAHLRQGIQPAAGIAEQACLRSRPCDQFADADFEPPATARLGQSLLQSLDDKEERRLLHHQGLCRLRPGRALSRHAEDHGHQLFQLSRPLRLEQIAPLLFAVPVRGRGA